MTLLKRISPPDPEEASAIEALYERYRKYIYTIAIQILHSPEDAEDILEDVMLNILRNREKFIGAETKAIESQIVIFTRNAAINLYHKNKWRQTESLPPSVTGGITDDAAMDAADNAAGSEEESPGREARAGPERSPEEALLSREASQIVRRYVAELEPAYRDAILLVYAHGYSNSEAAGILHISPNAVALRLYKAKKKLLAMAGEEFHENI